MTISREQFLEFLELRQQGYTDEAAREAVLGSGTPAPAPYVPAPAPYMPAPAPSPYPETVPPGGEAPQLFPGGDEGSYYDDNTLQGDSGISPGYGSVGALPAVLGVMALSSVVRVLGRRFITWVAARGARYGSRLTVPWGNMPGWVRTGLIALGFTTGADLLLDIDIPLIGDGGDGYGVGDTLPVALTGAIVKTWVANGRTFYKTSDGKCHTTKNDGSWTSWTPKKPIVIFPSGNKDLRDVLRADKAISREAGKIKSLLTRRGYQVRRKTVKK